MKTIAERIVEYHKMGYRNFQISAFLGTRPTYITRVLKRVKTDPQADKILWNNHYFGEKS